MIDGRQVAARRIARSMSQEELAGAASVSSRTVQRVERGARASLETTKALAAVLGEEVLQPRHAPQSSLGDIPAARFGTWSTLTIGATSIGLMTLELILPNSVGLFVWSDGRFSIGVFDESSVGGSVDLLGRWVLLPMALPALVSLASFRRSRKRRDAHEGAGGVLFSGTRT